jgi:WD40 repeat protein
MAGTLADPARPRRFPRIRRPRGRWLLLSGALVVAAAGTATGLVLASGGAGPDPGSWPLTAAFSADGRYLVTGGLAEAQLIDAASGRVLAEWQPKPPPLPVAQDIDSIGIGHDDKTIVTVNYGYVMRWSVADVLAAGVGGHPRPLSAFRAKPQERTLDDVLSPDGTLLAVNDHGGHVVLWNTGAGQVIARVGGTDEGGGLQWISPDDKVLAFSHDGRLQLRSIPSVQPRSVRIADSASYPAVEPAVFTPDDGVVLTHQAGAVTRLLDSATGKQLAVLPQDQIGGMNAVTISPATGLIAVGNVPTFGWVTIWSTASGRVIARLAPPHQPADNSYENLSDVYRLAFSPNGKVLAILPGQGPARLWQAPQSG